MATVRCVFSICAQNFRKWQTDCRIWIVAALMIIMVSIYADDIFKLSSVMEAPNPVLVFPFLYSQFYMKLVFTIPLVLLFCDAPFFDSNQTFVYMRAGRVKWLLGQILYIFSVSAVYYIFLLLSSSIFMLASGNFTFDWGTVLTTLASDPSVVQLSETYYLCANLLVIQCFTPISAVWFTFLLSWLTGAFLGLLIFFCNLSTGAKTLGIMLSSSFIALSYAVEHNFDIDLQSLIYFSPVSWTTLDNIDVGGLTQNPSFSYCVTAYAIILSLLTAVILIFGRKKSLDVKE